MLLQLQLIVWGEMAFQISLCELSLIEVGLLLWHVPSKKCFNETLLLSHTVSANNTTEIAKINMYDPQPNVLYLKNEHEHALEQFMNK